MEDSNSTIFDTTKTGSRSTCHCPHVNVTIFTTKPFGIHNLRGNKLMRNIALIWIFGILLIAAFTTGIIAAYSQFVPPPPVVNANSNSDPSFTGSDRAKLNAIYRMSRAIHTKLFPLSEEQRLLNGGGISGEGN